MLRGEEHACFKKNSWGSLKASWVPHDTRDTVVDFVRQWSNRTGIAVTRFINWLEIRSSKYYNWQTRYGQVNEDNGLIPRDFWLDVTVKLTPSVQSSRGMIMYAEKFSGGIDGAESRRRQRDGS
jgi:hypothetical protein